MVNIFLPPTLQEYLPIAEVNAAPHRRKSHVNAQRFSAAVKATNALNSAAKKRRQQALEDDIDAHFAYRGAEIVRLAALHSVKEEVVRKLLCNATQLKRTRRPSLRNAFIHDLAVKARDAGDTKNLRDLQDDLADAIDDGDIVTDPELLDDNEKKRLIDQLIEHRATKKRGMRATNRAAAMDGTQTAQKIGDAMLDLFERTGIRGFAMFSRGNPDDAALPVCLDSDDALDFFQQVYDIPWADALRAFERHCCTMDNGTKDRKSSSSVRKQIISITLSGLRKVSKDRTASMSYEHYDYDIRELRGCELLGWPSDIDMQRPSKMSAENARKIRDGLSTGTIQWHRMSKKDHDDLIRTREAKRRETGEPAKKRAERSDRGRKHKKSAGKAKAKARKHVEGSEDESGEDDSGEGSGVDDSGEEDNNDEDEDEDEEAPRAGPASTHVPGSAPDAISSTGATAASTSSAPAGAATTHWSAPTAAAAPHSSMPAAAAATHSSAPAAAAMAPPMVSPTLQLNDMGLSLPIVNERQPMLVDFDPTQFDAASFYFPESWLPRLDDYALEEEAARNSATFGLPSIFTPSAAFSIPADASSTNGSVAFDLSGGTFPGDVGLPIPSASPDAPAPSLSLPTCTPTGEVADAPPVAVLGVQANGAPSEGLAKKRRIDAGEGGRRVKKARVSGADDPVPVALPKVRKERSDKGSKRKDSGGENEPVQRTRKKGLPGPKY
ncbi:hypothetical protein B0H15DRAFT_799083 [Mycena belliarum]|uniref:Uncharacterized protein n=1 Tax=Mycena belliarum TaxID=1033014 RepID=A0AAD6UE58_9AGAR|nr:hypothetical protein B0H15DRAFT_799083 [Mycena belliae]